MLRSTHERELATLKKEFALEKFYRDGQEVWGEEQHKKQVAALEAHIADLRKLIFAPSNQEAPSSLVEADKALTQNDDEAPFPNETSQEQLERDNLLNGTWDEVKFN